MSPSKIEWTDETWNPVTGCTPISEGCAHCYAKRMANRLRGRCGYPKDDPFRVTLHDDRLDDPFRWKKPRRVFVCSMGDLFHEDVEYEDQRTIFEHACLVPTHTFMFLTKRPKRMAEFMNAWYATWWFQGGGVFYPGTGKKIPWPPPNLWLGFTAENQKRYNERWEVARQIPAAVTFVSMEPMLGPIKMMPLDPGDCPDWVIVGGETGPGARLMRREWVESVSKECRFADIPYFFKKWGKVGEFLTEQEAADLERREYPEQTEIQNEKR